MPQHPPVEDRHRTPATGAVPPPDPHRAQWLRQEVLEKTARLFWLERHGQGGTDEHQRLREELRVLVSRRSPFTMLIRSRVQDYLSDLFD